DAFPDGGGGNEEGGGGVGPGPSEGGVKKQAGQQHGGQASAQQGLPGVGDRAGRAQFAARAALGNRQDRHDGQGHGSQRYARDGVPSPGIAGQHPDGVGGDVGGEREEGDGNDPQRGPLPGLAYGGVAGGELPGDRGGGGDLDDGVQAEGDQRGGGGDRAGGDGDDRLDDVVAHGRGDEQADAAGELVAAGGACYWGYRGHRQQRPGACSSGHARSASTAMTAARRSSRAWPRRLSASS